MAARARGDGMPPAPACGSAWIACTAAMVILWSCGCGDNKPASPTEAKGTNAKGSSKPPAAAGVNQRCQTMLAGAIDSMKPEKLGVSSASTDAVNVLNNWVRDCGNASTDADPPPADPLLEKLIPEPERAAAASQLYDVRDVEHVRDCLLLKQAGSRILRASRSDAERVVAMFEFATRLVALQNGDETVIPQTLYEVVMLGKGTAEDRAWVFGELLRQAGMDSIILKPRPKDRSTAASATPAKPARWLVGVLVDKQVLLFDPSLGWPIPARDEKPDAPIVREAATLADVVAGDALLRKLDASAERPYPLHADELKSLDVQIITSTRYWLPRTRRLEAVLSGERSATVSTVLGDVAGRPGLISRVVSAGGGLWKKEDVSVWDYPDRQTVAAAKREGTAAQVHAARWLPFEGPVTVEFDKGTLKPQVGAGRRMLIKSRLAQLQGDMETAVHNYVIIQLQELPQAMPVPKEAQADVAAAQRAPPGAQLMFEVPKRAFATNYRGAEDAQYWMAICQMEQNELETAAETLNAYVARYQQGNWSVQAELLHATVLAQSKRYALAVQAINQILKTLPDEDPRRLGCELSASRWRTARDAAKPTDPKATEQKSEPPKSAEGVKSEDKPKAP